jgi:hypothetical protein
MCWSGEDGWLRDRCNRLAGALARPAGSSLPVELNWQIFGPSEG